MGTERITVNLPQGFDPGKHLAALERRIADTHGEGFEVTSINVKTRVASATRQATITEVSANSEDSFEVRLPKNVKPSDGERVATRLSDEYVGCEMTRFEPFLGKATLTKSSPEVSRARGALAVALGVKPWEVQVVPRPDGGFELELPNSYVPSKHDEKLDEVAIAVVGRPGWYVRTNPQQLRATIIPSDPPTFPPAIAYPFQNIKKMPRDQLLIGMQLADPGQQNKPVSLDFEAAPHTQISGTSGSGKVHALFTAIPVPFSARFPTGWALVKDLRAGDRLYGKDGRQIRLLGLSNELTVDLYEVHFSDGQVSTVGPEHLWRASSARQRNNRGQNDLVDSGQTSAHVKREGYAEELRAVSRSMTPGTFASPEDIAKIAKCEAGWVRSIIRANDISVEHVWDTQAMPVRRKTMDVSHFAADSAFAALIDMGLGTAMQPEDHVGEWRTARDIAFITGLGNDKRAATSLRRRLRSRAVPEKKIEMVVESVPHDKKIRVNLHPVAETLDLMAEAHLRNYDVDGIHHVDPTFSVISTEDMAAQIIDPSTGAHNWSVELAGAIQNDAAVLPVPAYTLGAWLGDGSRHRGSVVSEDSQIIGAIEEGGHPVYRFEDSNWIGNATNYFFTGLNADIKALYGISPSKVVPQKRIPSTYLRASYDQRLALLRGLMDTDGTISAGGTCELSLSDKPLATDALELIRSLGIKASCSWDQPASYRDADGEVVACKDRHRIHFTTTTQVFGLARKAARIPTEVRETQHHLYVTDIKKVRRGRAKCLRVDSPDGMYLTGGFIQTHNSVTLNTMITGVLAGGSELVIVDLAHKAQPLTTRIPVPISDRFKDGWAMIGDLVVGDEAYSRDGSITPVTGLAPIEHDADVYEVEFSDGQVIKADGEHLWPVQTFNDRQKLSQSYKDARSKQWSATRTRIAERTGPLKRIAIEAAATRRKANVAGLAEIIGTGTAHVSQIVRKAGTPSIKTPTEAGVQRLYSVDEFLTTYIDILERDLTDAKPTPGYRLVTTKDISENLHATKRGMHNYSVPLAAPVGGPDLDLPIAPYILGTWLGDGSTNSVDGNSSLFQSEGLVGNKHVPAVYLRASKVQRAMLLQGLLDSTSGEASAFTASGELLAEGVLELARSLGFAATVNHQTFTVELNAQSTQRFIVDVRQVATEPVRCITVGHPEHLFLTEGFVPTHNSVDFFWCKDFVRDGGWGCASLAHQVTAMALVYEEGQRRAKVLADAGATKWTELPKADQFKPIFVLVDEVTGLIQMDDKPQGVPKDHPMMQEVLQSNLLRATLLSHMKKIAAEMRFVGIRMVLSSQVSSVNTGIPTALRMNLANKILLGANPTDGNRKLSLADPTSVPKVPDNVRQDGKASKGVGVGELEGQPPSVFKSFYAPTEDFRKALDALGLRKTLMPEPGPEQIARLTPSLEDDGSSRGNDKHLEGRGPELAPSGKPAAQLRKEMGDEQDWAIDPETGKPLTGYAKANAARSAVVAGSKKPPRKPDANNPFADA